MSTTISGNIKNLGTAAVANNAFIRFWLRGTGGNQPRVGGTALVAPTQGGAYYFDFVPNSSGVVSGTLYSSRDAAGTGAGEIEVGGSTTAVWYGMTAYLNGKPGPEVPVHAKTGTTLDISNVTPITTNPVITAPTGDTTYARIDGGNTPFTGRVQTKILNDYFYVQGYGAICNGVTDDTTAVQAAVTAAVANGGGTVVFPTGKTTLLTAPITISGTLIRLMGSQSDNNNGASTIVKNATLGPIFQTSGIDAQLSMLNLDLQGDVTATGGVGATIDGVKLVGDSVGNDSTIRACTFVGLRRGVWTQGRNVAIIDNIFTCTQTSIYIDAAAGGAANRDFTIRGNRFHQNGASATDADIYVADNVAFVFEISQNFHDYGLLGRFFYAPNSATQVHITDNIIYSGRKTAIEFLDGTDVKISGNSLIFGPVGTDTDVSGIVFRNLGKSEISHNLIEQAHRYGIYGSASGSAGLAIHGNTIYNASFAQTGTYDAIYLAGASDNISIENNLIYNDSQLLRYGINVVNGAHVAMGFNNVDAPSCATAAYYVGTATFDAYTVVGDVFFTSGSTNGTKLSLESTGTNGHRYAIGSNNIVGLGEFGIYDYTAAAERFRIQSDGTFLLPKPIASYNGIAAVSNGVPTEYAQINLTAQNAAIGTTTLYAVPASGAGQYRVTWDAKVTTAATTGAATSTLGALTIVYTDPDGVAQTITANAQVAAGTMATTSSGNSTTTVLIGLPLTLNCKASTNITYAMAYASDTANQMQYNLHIRLEAL